jgi:tRNA pseudouridine38-40 synthase
MHAAWVLEGDELHFTIKANRFLRNMVRAIVGTMVNIGLGKMNVDDLHTVIQSKSRSEAGFSVPAHGLYLTQIEYPEDIIL